MQMRRGAARRGSSGRGACEAHVAAAFETFNFDSRVFARDEESGLFGTR